ncbi:DUF4097 family beta strand repeat-containing protein [Lysinibacillus sphaericus]|uniref:DUF4097 domain-containing protein n=1 Tax=Lysinibacillus sphaericus OT4b.31 TaxID=1285586 RepID=R7ZAU2_LYSSH|nr:DUF4097 family beta strand repeat-containing protein [Lysinibacillus sphaericus]EON71257.1 hypothetical protein H131_17756 [Lysinibacillus sphaericus OT4b.31]
MKKAIIAFLLVGVIGGVVFSLKAVGEKSYKKEQSFDGDQIEEVEINSESWNIELKSSKSKKITVMVDGKQQNSEKNPVSINKVENKIKVQQQDSPGGVLGNVSFGKKGTLHISLPNNGVNMITVNNSNGDIKINNIVTKDIIITNDSGSKIIKGLSADKGKITSKDGELSIMDSSLNDLAIASTNGDSYVTRVISPKLEVTSTSGEVLMKEMKEGTSLSVETGSGDITISYKDKPKSLKFIATSESSDITVHLDGYQKGTDSEKLQQGKIGDASNKLELISREGIIHVN